MTKKTKRPRRFRVWLDKNLVVGGGRTEAIVDLPAGASRKTCEEACEDALTTMIGNELDTGWVEIDEDGNDLP